MMTAAQMCGIQRSCMHNLLPTMWLTSLCTRMQVTRIFNAVSCEAFLRVVTTVLVRGGSRRDADGADGDEAMEVETGPAALDDASRRQLCAEALAGFAVLLETHGLAEQPDILRRCQRRFVVLAVDSLEHKIKQCWMPHGFLGLELKQLQPHVWSDPSDKQPQERSWLAALQRGGGAGRGGALQAGEQAGRGLLLRCAAHADGAEARRLGRDRLAGAASGDAGAAGGGHARQRRRRRIVQDVQRGAHKGGAHRERAGP